MFCNFLIEKVICCNKDLSVTNNKCNLFIIAIIFNRFYITVVWPFFNVCLLTSMWIYLFSPKIFVINYLFKNDPEFLFYVMFYCGKKFFLNPLKTILIVLFCILYFLYLTVVLYKGFICAIVLRIIFMCNLFYLFV